jgi:hypothetical protein
MDGFTYLVLGNNDVVRTDGSVPGTTEIKSFALSGETINGLQGISGQIGSSTAIIGDKIYFTVNESDKSAEVWSVDASGAQLVQRFEALPLPGWLPSTATPPQVSLASLGDSLIIAVLRQDESGLYVSDGSAEGTKFVAGLDLYPWAATMATLDGAVYVQTGSKLWRTDGTTEGTVVVADSVVNTPPSVYEGKVLFVRNTGGMDELWVTDGTAGDTHELVGLNQTGSHFELLAGNLLLTIGPEVSHRDAPPDIPVSWLDLEPLKALI